MAKREIFMTIDLSNKYFSEIFLKQLDSTKLQFLILNNGQKMNLDGLTANIIFLKPNKKVVIQSADVDSESNTVIADLLIDCVRLYGKGKIEVELRKDEEIISSFQIEAKIEPTGKNNVVSEDTETYIEKLDNILKEVEKLKESYIENEASRVLAEEERNSEETIRENNEETRVENETNRRKEEEKRIVAESSRSLAEEERNSEETIRKKNEEVRAESETNRDTAEKTRETNEEARKTAENKREEYITELKTKVDNGEFKGEPNVLEIGEVTSGDTASAEVVGDSPNQKLNLVLPQGPQGPNGISITKIEQTVIAEGDGEVNQVRIFLSNDQHFDIQIKNGSQGPAGKDGTNATTTDPATQRKNGLMSSTDKTKLDNMPTFVVVEEF